MAPHLAERTLLTFSVTLFSIESMYRRGIALTTSELKVSYSTSMQSQFWRV